jgi:hypothetical protein
MPSISRFNSRRGGKNLLRLLALFLGLAVAAPMLLAQDGDRKEDHGRFADSIVGSWIIHITVKSFSFTDPTATPPPLPLFFDNLTAFWEEGITTSTDPTQGTSYGVWKKMGPRTYFTKIIQVNPSGTITTVFGDGGVLSPKGDEMAGPFHGFDTDTTGKIIDQFSGTVTDNRITFHSTP